MDRRILAMGAWWLTLVSVGSAGATLTGTINAHNASTTVTFQYGTTVAYGSSVDADQSPVTGSSGTAVSKAVTGLSPGVTYHFRVVGVNSGGTTNGSDQTFTTNAVAPTVSTTAASSVTASGASTGGEITATGGAAITARGVCYGTSANPTLSDGLTSDGSGIGEFTSTLTGLDPNTTYHVRAYATNSVGTGYGSDLTFTTAVTSATLASPSSTVTGATTATLGGTISALGGDAIATRGIIWSTIDNFTEVQGTVVSENGSWTTPGAFTLDVTGLPAATTVYFRAFTVNASTSDVGFTAQSSFTTDKANQTITFDVLTAKTYGDATFNLSADSTSGLTVTFASSDPTVASIAGTTVTILKAGQTTITASQAGNATYNPAADVERTLTVQKKTLTVAAYNEMRDYGQANPDFTLSYDGFVGSDDAGDLDTPPTATCTADASSPAGDYDIVPAGGLDDNYDFSYQNGSLAVMGHAPTIQTPSGTLTSTTSATLGGSIASTGGFNTTERGVYWSTASGFTPPGEGTKVAETGTWSATGAFSVNVTGLPIGTTVYFRAFATSDGGTTFSDPSSITTQKNDQAVTFDVLSDKTYGEAPFTLTATASSGLPVAFTSSNTSVATVSGATVTILGAGSTTITAGQAGNATYNAAPAIPRTLTVHKKTLTVMPDNQTRNAGQPNPTWTLVYAGFVAGDTAVVLDTAPTATCSATPDSPAGTYDITPAGGVDNHYTFTYQKGTLTVVAVPPPTPTVPPTPTATPPPTPTLTPTPTPTPTATGVTDSTGTVTIHDQTLTAGVTGAEPNTPVTLTTDSAGGSATIAVGSSTSPQQPAFAATLSGVTQGTTVNVAVDPPAQQQTLQVTQPSGRKVNVILVQFPEGSTVGLNLANAQQIVSSITNATGQALNVDIQTQDTGGDITFTITYHPPTSSGTAKTIYLSPGGSMTIQASGVPADGVYKLAVSYTNVPLGRTTETDLRLMKVVPAAPLQSIGTTDRGNTSATATLGDYGIDTAAKKVWANVDTLGTFAVGVPKTPVEAVTQTITGFGCPVLAGLVLMLLTAGFVGLSAKKNNK